jgi:Uma2 family endonuclease
MVQTRQNILSFDHYLTYEDGTDTRYELVKGQLVAMTPPTWQHLLIARFLERLFEDAIEALGQDWIAFQGAGQQIGEATSRLPDVMVVPTASIQGECSNPAVLRDAAILVVEVVGPSSVADDYLHKLAEYESKGIAEYWIVDPQALGPSRYIGRPKQPTISVYQLLEGEYAAPQRFQSNEVIESGIFPELQITTQEIFQHREQ